MHHACQERDARTTLVTKLKGEGDGMDLSFPLSPDLNKAIDDAIARSAATQFEASVVRLLVGAKGEALSQTKKDKLSGYMSHFADHGFPREDWVRKQIIAAYDKAMETKE